jgi:site-specific DNA recombinase
MKPKRLDPPPNTCIIYCRVSTELQERDGSSLDTQEAACRAYAAQQGWTVVGDPIRDAASGATLQRPGLEKARALIREGQAAVLLAYAVDRVSREQWKLGVIVDDLIDHGARLDLATEDFDNSIIGKFIINVRAFAAEMDREKRREQTTRGRRAKIASGRYSGAGMPPYGYRRDKERGALVVYEPEAEIVRRIYRLIDAGGSITNTRHRLNAEHIPSPALTKELVRQREPERKQEPLWGNHSVQRILHDPTYQGEGYSLRLARDRDKRLLRRPREEWVRMPAEVCPAILDSELWERVQRRLATNTGATTRNQQRPYLLRGLIRCSVCGMAMSPEVTGEYAYYRCCSRVSRGACGGKPVNAERCDTAVWAAVVKLLRDPAIIAAELAQRQQSGPPATAASDLEQARRELAKVERQIRGTVARMGDLSEYVWQATKEELRRLEGQRSDLLAQLVDLERQESGYEDTAAALCSLQEYCRRAAVNLEGLDFDGRRTILEGISLSVIAAGRDLAGWRVKGAIPVTPDAGVASRPFLTSEQNTKAIAFSFSLSAASRT